MTRSPARSPRKPKTERGVREFALFNRRTTETHR